MRALMVIDVQFCMFFGDWPVPGSQELLQRIGDRILAAREQNEPVIFVQNDAPEGELDAPGMPMWQLVFSPVAGEQVFRKTTQNVFESNAEIAKYLKASGINELELVGLQSELCLSASARGAIAEGFGISVQRELHGTYNGELSASAISDRVQAELEQLMAATK